MNDLICLVIVPLGEVVACKRMIAGLVFRLLRDCSLEAIFGVVTLTSGNQRLTQKDKQFCVGRIFFQHVTQQGFCLVRGSGTRVSCNKRKDGLHGIGSRRMSSLQRCHTGIRLVLTGQRSGLDLIGNTEIVSRGPNGIGNGQRACPILSRQPHLGESLENLNMARMTVGDFE